MKRSGRFKENIQTFSLKRPDLFTLHCFILYLSIVNLFRTHIMILQPVLLYLFEGGTWLRIITPRVDADASPGQKLSPNFNISGLKYFNQIVHDLVDTVLVKIAVIAIAKQIKL